MGAAPDGESKLPANDNPPQNENAGGENHEDLTSRLEPFSRLQERCACSLMNHSEEFFYYSHIRGPFVIRQALDKHPAVLLLQDAVVEQDQQSAIVQ